MNRGRWERVVHTPAAVAFSVSRLLSALKGVKIRHGLAWLGAALFLLWGWLAVAWWEATTPGRAAAAYGRGDFNTSAESFASLEGPRAAYDAGNAWYRAGGYERALQAYRSVRTSDPRFKAAVHYNIGNTYIRLKEFEKAREAFIRSLALADDPQARENLLHILLAEEQDHLLTGRQEGRKRAQDQEGETGMKDARKRKEGGGSNQNSQADRHRGGGAQGRKVERELQLDFSSHGGNRLSSKQYELINQRSVHESNPW
jgi:Ca-activated chloride channel family protein